MLETLTAITEDVSSKKRGRKATTTNYFDVREEDAVKAFLLEEDYEERNKIYNEFLKDPLDKMISSIIRRYKLYRKDMDFREIHVDTHSFLITKVDEDFDENRDILILEGDIFHSRESINVRIQNEAFDIFKQLSKKFKRGIYIIIGNHDVYYKDKNEIHSLKSLSYLICIKVKVLQKQKEQKVL